MRVTALILTGLLFIAPAAAFSAEINPPVIDSILPDQESKEFEITFTLTCEEVWNHAPPLTKSDIPINVDLSPSHPGLSLTGPSVVLLDSTPCSSTPTSGTATTTSYFVASVTKNVPGLINVPYTLRANVTDGVQSDPEPLELEGAVVADYYGSMRVDVETPIQLATLDEEVEYELLITNFGNADMIAHFALQEPLPDGVRVLLPPPLIIPTSTTGGDHQSTATVTMVLPPGEGSVGFVNEIHSITVEVTNVAAQDQQKEGPSATASLQLRIRDAKGAPAPTLLLVAPALLGATLLARRRA